MKPREVVVSVAARNDLKAIWAESAQRWGGAQSDRYVQMIGARIDGLKDAPFMGPPRPDLFAGARSLVAGQHVVFYRAEDDIILIVRVLHQAMDAPGRFL